MINRDKALIKLEEMIENIKEGACEYRERLQQAHKEICNGGDVKDIMQSIL
jgi:hypothetical protein